MASKVFACVWLAGSLLAFGCSSGGEGTGDGTGTPTGAGSDGGVASRTSDSGSVSKTADAGTSPTKKAFGDDCTASDQCSDGKCVQFTGNDGKKHGFCSRQCTTAEDCPESGWECNLAPYTACVPK